MLCSVRTFMLPQHERAKEPISQILSASTDKERICAISEIMKLFVDELRIRILHVLLESDEMHVKALSRWLRMSQPAVSRHLALLRHAGVLTLRKGGKYNFYSISENFRELLNVCIPNTIQLSENSWQIEGDGSMADGKPFPVGLPLQSFPQTPSQSPRSAEKPIKNPVDYVFTRIRDAIRPEYQSDWDQKRELAEDIISRRLEGGASPKDCAEAMIANMAKSKSAHQMRDAESKN